MKTIEVEYPFPVEDTLKQRINEPQRVLAQLIQKTIIRRSIIEANEKTLEIVAAALLFNGEKQQYIQAITGLVDAICDLVISREAKVRYKRHGYRYVVDAQIAQIVAACNAHKKTTDNLATVHVIELMIISLVIFGIAGRLVNVRSALLNTTKKPNWGDLLIFHNSLYQDEPTPTILGSHHVRGLGTFLKAMVSYISWSQTGSVTLEEMQSNIEEKREYDLTNFSENTCVRVQGGHARIFLQSVNAYFSSIEASVNTYKDAQGVSEHSFAKMHEQLVRKKVSLHEALHNHSFMEHFYKEYMKVRPMVVMFPFVSQRDDFVCNYAILHNTIINLSSGMTIDSLKKQADDNLVYNTQCQERLGTPPCIGEEYRVLCNVGLTSFNSDVYLETGLPISPILKKTKLGDYERLLRWSMLHTTQQLLEAYEKWEDKEPHKKNDEAKDELILPILTKETDSDFLIRMRHDMSSYKGGIPSFVGRRVITMFEVLGFVFTPGGRCGHFNGDYLFASGKKIHMTIVANKPFCPSLIEKQCEAVGIECIFALGLYKNIITGADASRLKEMYRQGLLPVIK